MTVAAQKRAIAVFEGEQILAVDFCGV